MGSSEFTGALAPGTKLLEYEVIKLLGRPGGFGMTYLAVDVHLGKSVALKEYLPVDYAVRAEGNSVSLRSRQDRDAFEWGRAAFLREARVLARFKHRNVVSVHRFFEANGTAYIVMEYVQGETLGERFLREGQIEQEALCQLLLPIFDGLAHVHAEGVLHRDVKPDNIVITTAGVPVLIDFGAARNELGNRSRSAMNAYTTGYAPIEQYSDHHLQGPWTDIYALGAIAYRAIAGRKPLDAIARMTGAHMASADELGAGRYTPEFLQAVNWALQIKPADRPTDLAQWREAILRGGMVGPAPQSSAPAVDGALDFDLDDVGDDATVMAPGPTASSRAVAVPSDRALDQTIHAYLSPEERARTSGRSRPSAPPLRATRGAATRRPDHPADDAVALLQRGLVPLLALPRPARFAVAGGVLLVLAVVVWALIPDSEPVPTPVVAALPPAMPEPLPTQVEALPASDPVAPAVPLPKPKPPRGKPAESSAPVARPQPWTEPSNKPESTPVAIPTAPVASPTVTAVLTPTPPPVFEVTAPPPVPEPMPVVETAMVSPIPEASPTRTLIDGLQEQLKGPWRAENKMSASLDSAGCKVEIERVWDLRFNGLATDRRHLEGRFLVESMIRGEAQDGCEAFKVKVNERGTFSSDDERSDAVLLILHSFGCIGVDCDKVRDLPLFRSGKTEASVNFPLPPKYLRFAREGEDLVFRNGR